MSKPVINLMVLLGAVYLSAVSPGEIKANEHNFVSDSARTQLAGAGVDKLLFVKRYTYQSDHFYTDFINGCVEFGGNICVLSIKDGKVTELVRSMKDGIFGRYDLSFDGKRIVFGWKSSVEKGFRIYEVGVDGTGLRQLTFETHQFT